MGLPSSQIRVFIKLNQQILQSYKQSSAILLLIYLMEMETKNPPASFKERQLE
ncbi:hypothetical protein BT1A1_3088 [Caldibacillus thermoamylovorans]|jgi:hypothetical protein|uniref:Uncharacterized protein n=1 Tax=Caldibacillus thermoamylovorans TaxID=35841 RepID=A0A090KW11_9BACI|nr:hypothetical protein BT1A1_3088 [Caldibacillus thermoamylovorans]